LSREVIRALDKHIVDAVLAFARNVTVPIFRINEDSCDHIGTGVLFKIQNRYFLITAAHVVEGFEPIEISIPKANCSDAPILRVGGSTLYKPPEPQSDFIDLAVLEIHEPSTIENIISGWQALGFNNVDEDSSSDFFIALGYPSKLAKLDDRKFQFNILGIITSLLDEVPVNAKQPVDPRIDMFFEISNSSFDLVGNPVTLPMLKGASGCPIWAISQTKDAKIWSASNAMKIVGIQASAAQGNFIRGKNWFYLKKIFERIDPSLI
jgi:hypothetical protein